MECAESDLTEDEILAVLEHPIRDITENWSIDLSQLLQKYLNMLEISDVNEEALSAINFQKAAQLIQNSVCIYSKKVDYLWQVLLRVLEVVTNKKSHPVTEKCKTKKQTPCDRLVSPDFCELDDISDDDSSINIPPDFDEVRPPLKFLPKYNPNLDTKFSEKKLYLISSEGIIIGNKYDFRVNRHLSESGALVAEPQIIFRCLEGNTSRHLLTNVNNVEDLECHPFQTHTAIECVDLFEKQREEEPQELSAGAHCNSSDVTQHVSDGKYPPTAILGGGTPERSSPCEIPEDLSNTLVSQVLPKRKLGKKNKQPQPADIISYLVDDIASKSKKNCTFFSFLEYFSDTNHSSKKLDLFFNTKTEEVDKLVKELRTEVNEEFHGFEEQDLSSLNIDDGCDLGNNDSANFAESISPSTVGRSVSELPEDVVSNHFTDNVETPPSRSESPTYEEFAQNLLSGPSFSRRSDPHMTERVNKWHESIKDKLQIAEKRHQCNLRDYTSKILESFPKTADSSLSFREVVSDKLQEDVPRYFLASLMLANTYKVKIGDNQQANLAMDCMEMTRLNNGERDSSDSDD